MNNPNINWTKVYNVLSREGRFHIYISSQKAGYFIGAVFSYKSADRDFADKMSAHFEFVLEQFFGYTEDEVYQQCTAWLENFMKDKGDYEIVLDRKVPSEK